MSRRPRLLVLVTLAEAGGAQTFAGALVGGLQNRYDISVGAHGPGGALVETCARLGVPFYHLQNLARDPDLRLDVAAAIEIRRLVELLQPDVVQLNSSKAAFIARMALARTTRPVVYTVHGWAFSSRRGISSAFFAATERLASPFADAIVCVSAHDRRTAEARGVAHPDRLRVIHNAIASPAEPPRRGSWPERPVLICTARLAPPKDVLLLLDAFVEPGVESWRLKIIGDGPDREAIEARRDARGLRDRVELLGERRDVAEQLAMADAFVLPTHSEGMPYSILEAMASGLPVVASRVGGVPEEVIDGVTGLLVPAGDRRALASALRRLHDEPDASRRMGIAGHARAREHFRLETMVDSYDVLFRSLLSERLPRRAVPPRTRPEPTVPLQRISRAANLRGDVTRPRLLVIVTLAEVGGAQTFVSHLVEGLRDTYAIDVASHGRDGAVVETCARLGVRYHHLEHLVRDPDIRRDPAAILEIRALAKRLRPDLVHLNSSKAGVVARIALANLVPVVFTAHGWAFARPGRVVPAYVAIERGVAPLARAIVCVSEHDRRVALALHIGNPEKLHVIYNGVQAPEAPHARGPWPTRPRLACIARLAPQKDVALLLDALATPGLEAWQLKVFGDGPDRESLETRVARLALTDRVEFCGDRPDVLDQLASSDALALPSNWEGLPYSILEAMGAALPVVASSVGGVPELVLEGTTGFLVPRGDVRGFASALRRLHNDGATARRMGIAGHDRVRRWYTVATMVGHYDTLFRSILHAQAEDPLQRIA